MYASLEVKKLMGGCGGCAKRRGINASMRKKTINDLLTLEEMKEICIPCYEEMLKRKMQTIEKKFLPTLIEDLGMTLYEITYKGDATSYNFYGRSLKAFLPIYLTKEELPVSLHDIVKLDGIHIASVNLIKKPTEQEAVIKGAQMQGLPGIMWVGGASKRINDYGTFIRGEPRFDLPLDVISKLKAKAGFKVL